ncbi:MAG: hypothetical protein KAQ87_03630 [Candidatus Pacebacteria bacterium]|nr:hypothetical protein [Candidatus Paceibacterota bacterium]
MQKFIINGGKPLKGTVEKMRISVLLIGPLLARFKKFKSPILAEIKLV